MPAPQQNQSSPLPEIDTIVAISTPPGRGGIGIVRLSGPQAVPIASQLLHLTTPLDHAHARFARVLDPAQPAGEPGRVPATIDDSIVTAFHAPHSYTGENLVEIAAHGAPVVLEALVAAALTHGARLASPGEFTQRAFLGGRLDLTQAEAVHDLIAAQTLDQARVAAQQLGGAISRRVAPAKEALLHIITLLEAGMDFAPGELDDVDVVPPAQIDAGIQSVRTSLEALAASFQRGQILRDGAAIALIGPANAGKSSLFNRLLERDRAIVTPVPGTTRDTVEESFSLGGIPLRLIDTAGLRDLEEPLVNAMADTPGKLPLAPGASAAPRSLDRDSEAPALDLAEQQGVVRSREALADADLVLLVRDATQPLTPASISLAESLAERPHLLVANKIDLLVPPDAPGSAGPEDRLLATSALTGAGLDALRTAILNRLQAGGALAATGALNNLRQQHAVTSALTAIQAAATANANALPHELLLLDLHAALASLDSLTGATTPDDILARIFSTFCIGK